MKSSHRRHARTTALVLSTMSMLSFAQILPGLGNPVFVDGATVYKGDPLDANVKIDKVLEIQGQPPAGWVPKFDFQVGVREVLPQAPERCQWKPVTYNPPSGNTSVASGQNTTVQVKNVLVCEDKFCAEAKPLNINLGVATSWYKPGSYPTAMTHVTSPPGAWAKQTGTGSTPFAALGEWVSINSSGAPSGGNASAEIPFCLCGNSTARADVKGLKADNHADLRFDSNTPFLTTAIPGQDPSSFLASKPYISGPSTVITTPTTHTLHANVSNISSWTGFSMAGTLSISKGYLGACKLPK